MSVVHHVQDDVFEIPEFLSLPECDDLIKRSEKLGFANATIETPAGPIQHIGVRNNQRVVVEDDDLAAALWLRLAEVIPAIFKGREALGLNERIRFYRYDAGERFNWHRDGFVEFGDGRLSQFTFLIFLNDDYEGGLTSFRDKRFPTFVVEPKAGSALLFHHPISHRGDKVMAGRKYVLRSDVVYGPSVQA